MTDPVIAAPARFAPVEALAFGAVGTHATLVDADHPLPVTARVVAAGSAPLAGSASSDAVAGPFVPDLGRPILLTLSGSWSGSVQLTRSVDGGTTRLPVTLAGEAWGSYPGNCNEPVWVESEAGATLHLAITIVSGTLAYRVSQ
jgi:hypothetical protein